MLTDKRLQSLKPEAKPYKVADERGLYALVKPNGSILFQQAYRFGGVQKTLSHGTYPDTSLKLAREKRDRARQQLAAGTDPSAMRKAEKVALADSFEGIAREWLDAGAPGGRRRKAGELTADTITQLTRRLEKYVFPYIGSMPIKTITAQIALQALRKTEGRGKLETAHRARNLIERVFNYAIIGGRADVNPAIALTGAMKSKKKKHHAAITDPAAIGCLLRAIDGYDSGQPTTKALLQLSALCFVRPFEFRSARWPEFDLDADEPTWRISRERMKGGEDEDQEPEHVVPLARQAVGILKVLHGTTGRNPNGLVFPGMKDKNRPVSENTVNSALRIMGYDTQTQHTGHGFRTTASTVLNEHGFNYDDVEKQLAHKERDPTRDSYNRAQRLAARRKMMQWLADYYDALKAGTPPAAAIPTNVVPLRSAG